MLLTLTGLASWQHLNEPGYRHGDAFPFELTPLASTSTNRLVLVDRHIVGVIPAAIALYLIRTLNLASFVWLVGTHS